MIQWHLSTKYKKNPKKPQTLDACFTWTPMKSKRDPYGLLRRRFDWLFQMWLSSPKVKSTNAFGKSLVDKTTPKLSLFYTYL